MIRPDLRDLINRHKPIERLNNNNDNNNNDFQNALDDTLNYQTIEYPQGISKLKPDINKNNWEGINFPAGSKEWQKFEQNNDKVALDILYVKKYKKKYFI